MSALRAALFLILAGNATSALAEHITCESPQGNLEACTTVPPRSSIRMVEQLSNTPCIEGRNWGVDTNHNSIWISGGCRAVFDVQAPRSDPNSEAQYRDDELREEPRMDEPRGDPGYASSQYSRADSMHAVRDACIEEAASGQAFRPAQVAATNPRWIGHGMLSVNLDTPAGPLICTVDREGNVRSIDSR